MSSDGTIYSADQTQPRSFWSGGMGAVVGIAAFSFALHFYFNNRYDYFRDEFDYIICGNHPAWGYVDQPPLLPILVRICREIFGDSLRSIRLIPAITNAAVIV